ncbi:hypothetical protein [Nocardioides sp. cx-173]|uniref:hypothetical protein n=1 Tax=Nocardioides sp. cx-173 TaxID=2898796 RepID=UPI001E2F8849|nr:hypothetical protein [Nocardioides sp. cx-173]MCD4527419.1 hypothetical protein [Nocardioides sp. cx-173]UGB41242.1 hypothetical protein LQ940_17960 [Nocardioides sp. cx-173]
MGYDALRPGRRALLLLAALAVVLAVAGTLWWRSGADERRLVAACESWDENRASLTAAIAESEDAAEAAAAARAELVDAHVEDPDALDEAIDRWLVDVQAVIETLWNTGDTTPRDRELIRSFADSHAATWDLRLGLRTDTPSEVGDTLSELERRLQATDGACASPTS